MPSYEQALAYWRAQKLETAADIDRVLDWFKVSFAFQSGRLSDSQITYRDTVSIFEKDSVIEYTGVVRSLLEQRNQRLCYEFTRARLVERAPMDIPLVLEVHKILTNGTYDQSRYIDNGERPGRFKKHDYGVGLHEVGAPAARVEREVADLLDEVNGYTGPWVLKAAAYFHARFEHLYPFADGNGRVGRTLLNYYLIQHDHPPLVIFEELRDAYYAALTAYDEGEDIGVLEDFLREMTAKTWLPQTLQMEEQDRGHKPLAAFATEETRVAPCEGRAGRSPGEVGK